MRYLVIFNGESNSGGTAQNNLLTAPELAVRSNVQILNNATLSTFDSLEIGVNNLVGHTGITSAGRHGWENGLANAVFSGALESPAYLVKTGQGGSVISQWDVGGAYFNTFTNRVNAAKGLLAGQPHKTVIWYTQGINDAIAGTNIATWKTATIQHIANLRSIAGVNTPVLITSLTPIYNPTWLTAIQDVISQVSSTYLINTATIGADAFLRDENHWDTQGMRLMASELVRVTKLVLPSANVLKKSHLLPNFKPNFKLGNRFTQ